MRNKYQPAPAHNPACHTTREWFGPFPVTTTHHHETCTNRVGDDGRTR